MGYQAVTEHHTLSPPYLLSWLCYAQWLLFFPSEPTTSHTQRVIQKTKKQHWNNYTCGAWTQCSAAPLCLLPLTLCVSVCVHVCIWNALLFTQVRKYENPQQLLPKGSPLIAPTTSRPKQFISNWQNKRQTQSRSVPPQAARVLIYPFNPQKTSELQFKDVFKSLRQL